LKIVFYFAEDPSVRQLAEAAAASLHPGAFVVISAYIPSAIKAAIQLCAEVVAYEPAPDIRLMMSAAASASRLAGWQELPRLNTAVDNSDNAATNVADPILVNTLHSPREAEAWRWYFIGLEAAEIGEKMGITDGAVRTLLDRARAKNEGVPYELSNLVAGLFRGGRFSL